MSNSLLVLIIVAIISLIAFVWLFEKMFAKRNSQTNKCPYCDSTDLVENSREVVDTNTVEQHGGGYGGGGDIRVQTVEEVTYRCNSCQQRSSVTVRRTN